MSSGSLSLSLSFPHEDGRRTRFFRRLPDRSISPSNRRDSSLPSLVSSPPPLPPFTPATHRGVGLLVQISILRRQLFATLLFFHSVTHMEMEIGHRNPVWETSPTGRDERERGRGQSRSPPRQRGRRNVVKSKAFRFYVLFLYPRISGGACIRRRDIGVGERRKSSLRG